MKTYNEMAENVFNRIGEYEVAQKRKRKIIKRTAVCMCCACIVAAVGIGSHSVINSKQNGVVQNYVIRSYGASPDSSSVAEGGGTLHRCGEGVLYESDVILTGDDASEHYKADLEKKYEQLVKEYGEDRITLSHFKDDKNVEHLKLTCVLPEDADVDLPKTGAFGVYYCFIPDSATNLD